MRITDKTTASNAIYNINEGRTRMDRLNEIIGSGRAVNRPSDNPVNTKKILEFETQIKTSNQYMSNIKTGQIWLQMASTSLEGMLGSVMSIKGIASSATNNLTDPIKKADMLAQLKAFRDQLTDYPNVRIGDQYVFSGFNSSQPPFGQNTLAGFSTTAGSATITNINTADLHVGMPITGPDFPADSIITAIPTPGATGTITLSNPATKTNSAGTLSFIGKFNGTENILSMEINKGVQVPIGVSGGSLLRGGTPPGTTGVDIIKTLDTLIADISSGNAAGIPAANVTLEKANQQILSAISDVGLRKSRLDNAQTSQQRNIDTLLQIHDNMVNIDYAKAAIELTSQKTAFEAALSATAKIAPISLLNYL